MATARKILPFVFLVTLQGTSGLGLDCGPGGEAREGSDHTLTCEGLPSGQSVYWTKRAPVFGDIAIANCSDLCQTRFPLKYDVTRPDNVTSILKIRGVTRDETYVQGEWTCSSGSWLASCYVSVTYQPQIAECDVEFDESATQVRGRCEIHKVYPKPTCTWYQQIQGNESAIPSSETSLTLTQYVSNSQIYFRATCGLHSPLPVQPGTYSYKVLIVPGLVEQKPHFISTDRVDFPAPPSLQNCPQDYVMDKYLANCTCVTSYLGSPQGSLAWYDPENNIILRDTSLALVLLFSYVTDENSGKTYQCATVHHTGSPNVTYTPKIAVAPNKPQLSKKYEGDDFVTLNCSATGGQPAITRVILGCGGRVNQSGIREGDTVVSRLSFQMQESDNNALCFCFATNEYRKSTNVTLTLRVKDSPTSDTSQGDKLKEIVIPVASAAGGLLVIAAIVYFVRRRQQTKPTENADSDQNPLTPNDQLNREFTSDNEAASRGRVREAESNEEEHGEQIQRGAANEACNFASVQSGNRASVAASAGCSKKESPDQEKSDERKSKTGQSQKSDRKGIDEFSPSTLPYKTDTETGKFKNGDKITPSNPFLAGVTTGETAEASPETPTKIPKFAEEATEDSMKAHMGSSQVPLSTIQTVQQDEPSSLPTPSGNQGNRHSEQDVEDGENMKKQSDSPTDSQKQGRDDRQSDSDRSDSIHAEAGKNEKAQGDQTNVQEPLSSRDGVNDTEGMEESSAQSTEAAQESKTSSLDSHDDNKLPEGSGTKQDVTNENATETAHDSLNSTKPREEDQKTGAESDNVHIKNTSNGSQVPSEERSSSTVQTEAAKLSGGDGSSATHLPERKDTSHIDHTEDGNRAVHQNRPSDPSTQHGEVTDSREPRSSSPRSSPTSTSEKEKKSQHADKSSTEDQSKESFGSGNHQTGETKTSSQAPQPLENEGGRNSEAKHASIVDVKHDSASRRKSTTPPVSSTEAEGTASETPDAINKAEPLSATGEETASEGPPTKPDDDQNSPPADSQVHGQSTDL